MSKSSELTGQKFNRLTVIRRNLTDSSSGTSRWDCVCECGTEKTVRGNNLKSGQVRSCGCLQKENISSALKTHGASRTPEHNIWKTIKQRTLNENNVDYPAYGGRGIKLCDRWKNSFESFIEDMGKRPSPSHSIDRLNGDGDYEPNNCRWSTPEEQANNKSTNLRFVYEDQNLTLAQIAKLNNVSYESLRRRIHRGQDIGSAVSAMKTNKE